MNMDENKIFQEYVEEKLGFSFECLCDGICHLFDGCASEAVFDTKKFLEKRYPNEQTIDASLKLFRICLMSEIDSIVSNILKHFENDVLKLSEFIENKKELFCKLLDEYKNSRHFYWNEIEKQQENISDEVHVNMRIMDKLRKELSTNEALKVCYENVKSYDLLCKEYENHEHYEAFFKSITEDLNNLQLWEQGITFIPKEDDFDEVVIDKEYAFNLTLSIVEQLIQLSVSLAVGGKKGYQLYALNSIDKLEKVFESDIDEVCIVERLFSSSLIAVVSLTAPRKLKVCHFKKGTEICNYSYSNTILSVKLNRERLIVCLEEALYIHNIHNMRVLHTIKDTPPNILGLCALSSSTGCSYLAYPGSSQIGEIQIFDVINLQAKMMIPAHHSILVALAFSTSGLRIASASEKGTVIRVFDIHDGSKLFEFRRGIKRCVTIHCLAFSLDDQYLAATSSTETVHIFKLGEVTDVSDDRYVTSEETWMNYLSKAVSISASYLPTQMTDVFFQGRSFAAAKLPFSGVKSICGITILGRGIVLLVASLNGYLYLYSFDSKIGGCCTLIKQHKFLDNRLLYDGLSDTTYKEYEKGYVNKT